MKRIQLNGLLMLLCFLVLAGCAMTPEQEYDKGLRELEKGYEQVEEVAESVDKSNRDAAIRHFNKAIKHFDNATVAFASVDLGPENKAAVNSLEAGLRQLEDTTKALQKDDYPKAAEHYTQARIDLRTAVDQLR